MEIEKLSRKQPLLDEIIWESEYAKVVQTKELTITANTDINLTVKVIFSIDGYTDGQEMTFKLNVGWSSRSIRRSLPYCKIVIQNETTAKNNMLLLSVISDKIIKDEPKPSPMEIKEADEMDVHHHQPEEHRSKSPFRALLSRSRRKSVSNKSSDHQECSCKVPEHVPKNGILIGEWGNDRLGVIPPPVGNIPDIQILTFQENKFEWVILTENEREKSVGWRFD